MLGTWDVARTLIVIGVFLALLGVIIGVLGRFVPIGRLPGDVVFRRGNFTFYFPLATCLVVSLVLTLLAWALRRR
jgi:hypothetical protein